MDQSIARARYMTRSRSRSMLLPSLPEEMIIEILAKLPVKSVIRFRVVCKRWSSLTRKPSFIRKHLRNCHANGITWSDVKKNQLPSSRKFGGFWSGIYSFLPKDLVSRGCWRERPGSVVGYCDGLFCFYKVSDRRRLTLCNPAIREAEDLPPLETEFYPFGKERPVVCGLGFDPKTEDYKAVEVVDLGNGVYNNKFAEVYSHSTRSWRVLKLAYKDAALKNVYFPYGSERLSHYTRDGTLHWCLPKKGKQPDSNDETILSFDLKDEVFRLTEFPSKYYEFIAMYPTQKRYHSVSLLHGKLALLCSFYDGSRTSIEVWVMENYKGEDSWSHVLSVDPLPGFCHALCFWRDSELVIIKGWKYMPKQGRPYLYDPAAKKMKNLKLSGGFEFIYTESLVPVKRVTGGELEDSS